MQDSIFATRIAQGPVLPLSYSLERAARLKAVRTALGLTQLEFLPVLNTAAAKVGVPPYSQSKLSKLESGSQAADFDDIAAFAMADRLQRGKLWLAWNEKADASTEKRTAPVATGYTKLSSAEKTAKKKA
jgi:transcriptional regulator with XRE-family HTH domain